MAKGYQSAEAILRELGENTTKVAKSALVDGAEIVMQEARNYRLSDGNSYTYADTESAGLDAETASNWYTTV